MLRASSGWHFLGAQQSMIFRAIVSAFAGVLLAITQAGATTYTYTGNPDTTLDYMTATVDLNCTGTCSGNYLEGSGLISFVLTVFNSSNAQLISDSTSDAGYSNGGYQNYLSLSNTGAVNNWLLYDNNIISTDLVYLVGPTNNYPGTFGSFGTYDYAQSGSNVLDYNVGNPGMWTASPTSPTPLPAALPLFATGLGALGLFGWRRKRKAAAITA